MGDITIHLEPVVDNEAIDRMKRSLPRVGKNEQLTIVMESADAHQADRVMEILRAEGFDYQPRGSNDGNLYHIIAKRAH